MMEGGKLGERRSGSVKAAVSSYGERIGEANPTFNKLHKDPHEKPFTKTRELHQAKKDTNQLNESRKIAELTTSEAKSAISAAKKTAKQLSLRIQESNSRAKAQRQDVENPKMAKGNEGGLSIGDSEYPRVMRELRTIKRELSKLKMDMASVLEERRRAEKEIDDSLSRRQSYLSSVEALNKEIEEVNEEHVLVELARIEAVKEYEEIEAQRREKPETYSVAIEETRKKKDSMIDEIDDAKELEARLAIATSNISGLQSELKQVKETGKIIERYESSRYDESGSESLLESVTKELEVAKKELAQVKEESFQFMASMDVVRNEIRHVADQTSRLKKKEETTEMTIQNLNSKLLRTKAKLEATSAAEERAKSIVSNLSLTLDQVNSDAETHNKERSLISEEIAVVKAETQRTGTEIDLAEEKLQAAFQDLKAVKSSEAVALDNLKAIIEKTIRNRASASRPSSKITISKFEYEYLTGNAAGARELADKKVAAARAWVEALKASEKEIQIKSELLRRETRELRVEEHDIHQTEHEKNIVNNDFEKWRQMMEPEKLKSETGVPGKAMNRSMKRTPTRRGKARISVSPLIRGTPRSKSFTVRRRKKVMPNLAKFFSGKIIERNQPVQKLQN